MRSCIIFVLALLLGFGAKASEADRRAGLDETMSARAVEFKQALASAGEGYRSGVYVYGSKSVKEYANSPEKLAERLSLLGFTDVYLGLRNALTGKDKDMETWSASFNRRAHELGLKVLVMTLSSPKSLYAKHPDVKRFTDEFTRYNTSRRATERFDGIAADLEPHTMKKGRAERPADLQWEWDATNNYGIGADNDMLQRQTVEVMRLAREQIGDKVSLSQAVGASFQSRFDEGKLSWGSAQQYLEYCDWLTIMAYHFNPKNVFQMSKAYLDAATQPHSVAIAIKTSLSTFGSEGPITSFMPQGWDYMVAGIRDIISKASTHTSFRGIDIFEYQGLEQMWNGSAVADGRTNYEKPQHKLTQ